MPNSSEGPRCLSTSQVAPSSFSCHCNSRTFATNQPVVGSSVTRELPSAFRGAHATHGCNLGVSKYLPTTRRRDAVRRSVRAEGEGAGADAHRLPGTLALPDRLEEVICDVAADLPPEVRALLIGVAGSVRSAAGADTLAVTSVTCPIVVAAQDELHTAPR